VQQSFVVLALVWYFALVNRNRGRYKMTYGGSRKSLFMRFEGMLYLQQPCQRFTKTATIAQACSVQHGC